MNARFLISDEDIAEVEQVMGKSFSDEERKKALTCLDSCDIQACPGSGKTTLLVAKLYILAKKMAGSKQGICVLSHTNAARNEIEQSLGASSSRRFRYPTFIGTIQSFVDRFLAIPAMIERYGQQPQAIDDGVFFKVVEARYQQIPRPIQYSLANRNNNDGIGLVCSIRYRFDDLDKIARYENGREYNFPTGEETETYQQVKNLKDGITRDGFMTYHDAFALANCYLSNHPVLSKVICKRFPFVFIDEMQDTDKYQYALLMRIFQEGSVVQYFGDSNQAIYHQHTFEADVCRKPQLAMQISSSHRLSCSIAALAQNLGVTQKTLQGNTNRRKCRHTIFLFDEGHAPEVIPAFGDLIDAEALEKGPYKALGAVGRLSEKSSHLSICSYWPTFERNRKPSKTEWTFETYLLQTRIALQETGDCSQAYQLLVEALLKVAQCQGSNYRRMNSGEFLKAVKERGEYTHREFRNQLLSWCCQLDQSESIDLLQYQRQIDQILSPSFGELSGEAIRFITEQKEILQKGGVFSAAHKPNIYIHNDKVEIEIDTIHGAKGQTHQATLLLETFYNQFHLQTILPYFYGQTAKKPGVRITQKYLPLAYVAATRPTDLLCLAMPRSHLCGQDIQQLSNKGWVIQRLN